MENEILDLIDRYWKFDNDQKPVSNWHDKQDLLEAVRKALRIHDVSGSLPLADLEKRLDEALDKETPETLNKWLEEKRK